MIPSLSSLTGRAHLSGIEIHPDAIASKMTPFELKNP
jgi:hypothetical protein